MYRRPILTLLCFSAFMGLTAVGMALYLDRSLLDPEGFLGPAFVRLPLLVLLAMLADLVPRTLWLSRFKPAAMWPIAKQRLREHWTKDRTILTAVGVMSFYLTYVCYRNIKHFWPLLLGERKFDRELHLVDRALMLGNEPGTILHTILPWDWVAHFLSSVYLSYLPMVAISVAIYVVWTKNLRMAYWFVIATCLTWGIGAFAYYALPTLGPGFQYLWLYSDLPSTGASQLMYSLKQARDGVLWRGVQDAVQSVGGFPSLHTAITLLWALMVQYTVKNRIIRWVAWSYFCITVVATIYFGWHYIADDLGGATIALFSFYVGGRLAGFTFDRRRTDRPVALPVGQWPPGYPDSVVLDDLHPGTAAGPRPSKPNPLGSTDAPSA